MQEVSVAKPSLSPNVLEKTQQIEATCIYLFLIVLSRFANSHNETSMHRIVLFIVVRLDFSRCKTEPTY